MARDIPFEEISAGDVIRTEIDNVSSNFARNGIAIVKGSFYTTSAVAADNGCLIPLTAASGSLTNAFRGIFQATNDSPVPSTETTTTGASTRQIEVLGNPGTVVVELGSAANEGQVVTVSATGSNVTEGEVVPVTSSTQPSIGSIWRIGTRNADGSRKRRGADGNTALVRLGIK